MKKLGKLQINPEKLIKKDELISLRGGYDDGTVELWCLRNGDTCVIVAPGYCWWQYHEVVCREKCPGTIGYYCFDL